MSKQPQFENDALDELARLIGQGGEDEQVFVSHPDSDFSLRNVSTSELDEFAGRIKVREFMRDFGKYRPRSDDAFFYRPCLFEPCFVRKTQDFLRR